MKFSQNVLYYIKDNLFVENSKSQNMTLAGFSQRGSHYYTLNITILHIRLFESESETCGQVWWPILRICSLHLTHPSAHTHTHTVNAHPGELLGVRCLAQGIVGGRERWTFTPPPTIPAGPSDSNHDLRVTSPTLYLLDHNCPHLFVVKRVVACAYVGCDCKFLLWPIAKFSVILLWK